MVAAYATIDGYTHGSIISWNISWTILMPRDVFSRCSSLNWFHSRAWSYAVFWGVQLPCFLARNCRTYYRFQHIAYEISQRTVCFASTIHALGQLLQMHKWLTIWFFYLSSCATILCFHIANYRMLFVLCAWLYKISLCNKTFCVISSCSKTIHVVCSDCRLASCMHDRYDTSHLLVCCCKRQYPPPPGIA